MVSFPIDGSFECQVKLNCNETLEEEYPNLPLFIDQQNAGVYMQNFVSERTLNTALV